MSARRLVSFISVCALALVFAAGTGSTFAATQFGGYGTGAEQLNAPVGVAVDSMGDVYVGDQYNNRVDKFDGSGNYLFAWGAGPADGVAVDNDPLSSSYGDVYVVDEEHSRVEKFDASGKFLLMFGGEVNETTGGDICRAGETCKLYAATGSADGEFSYMLYPYGVSSFIAVGPTGVVYVGDNGRVEVFESSGAWKENISLAGLSSEARPTALAVDSMGDVFLKDSGMPGVHEFEANGTEKNTEFDGNSTSVTALALDSDPTSSAFGDVFVGDSSGGFHVLQYDSGGKELASFASKTVQGENLGLAFSSTTGELYASEANGSAASIWVIPLAAPGPLIDSESAIPGPGGASTLEAQVNPEGSETTVHIEYVDEADFKESGYANATSTAPVSIGSTPSFEDQLISAHPALVPGTVYHYRVVASNSQGTATGTDQSFQEIPPALIVGPWATDVAGTSITIDTQIDPQGADTTYRLEYGTSTSYGHVLSGSVGEGTTYVTIGRHIQELEPVTTYHYRIVTSNEVGTWQSADHTLTTQATGGELALPDSRVWELVSPADKHGALIEPELKGLLGDVQAAGDGSGIAYLVSEPITERPPSSYGGAGDQILSSRGPGGWTSHEVGVAEAITEGETGYVALKFPPVPVVFSTDLSQVVIEPAEESEQPLSPEATERTLYLRDNSTGEYLPLVNPSNVPVGTKFGGALEAGLWTPQRMLFLAATPDLSHVVFQSPLRLTPEAVEGPGECTSSGSSNCPQNLYEWSAGRLALVDVLPNGEPMRGESIGGAYLGRTSEDVIHAVSNDGRMIVWAAGGLISNGDINTLYVRDMVEHKTFQMGGPTARFETMSGDGSRVFFWENSELFVFDVATDTTTDLTANHGPGEHGAGVKDGFIMAASEDGAYVYYAATGVLASGAVSGEDNLYVSHYEGGGWTTSLIATLSKSDEFAHEIDPFSPTVYWMEMAARVSPNGRYLAFMSSRSLTGYDNLDAVSGRPDEEAYLYDAISGRLVCASCNPSGARPVGLFDSGSPKPLVDGAEIWVEHWIAANFPGFRQSNTSSAKTNRKDPVYQPRYLSDSGRLFFNSSDALVAQDTNGVEDVYEYEPAGVGSCTNTSALFSERSGGCVGLISSGTSSAESAFMDASENGADVFFVTGSKLVAEDVDASSDVYDAHICTAAVPCGAAPLSPPACTSGDSCKAAPSSQPEIFGPAPSATFSGAGNVAEEGKKNAVKRKAKKSKRHVKKRKHKGKRARRSRTGRTSRKGNR